MLFRSIAADTAVSGFALDGVTALTGTVKSSVAVGGTTLKVVYFSSEVQSRVPSCAAGGLPATSHIISQTGCFHATRALTVAAQTGIAAHTINPVSYDPVTDTKAGRTLRGFSTGAGSKMRTGCPGCPYTDFIKAYEYYGVDDYSDRWVIGALTATKVDFNGPNGRGSADFSTTNDGDTRVEAAKKGAAYMGTWMYVVREFEDAIDDCVDGAINRNDDPVHAWDEGVAFYTGSNAGEAGYDTVGGAKNGNMIYALANKRCKNFKTCGVGEFSGNSAVNIALFDQFALGKNACQVGNCPKGQGHLDKIIPLMSVPLIQGTLRYAYKVAVLQDAYKGYGEGYAFMMSVIHRVHFCSAADAKIIYEALDVPTTVPGTYALGGTAGVGIAGYTAVKEAFERNYACMGVTCADIGDLYSSTTLLAAGCVDPEAPAPPSNTETEVLPTWAIIAIAAAGAMMVLFFGLMCAYKSSKDMTIKMYNDLKKEGAVGKV